MTDSEKTPESATSATAGTMSTEPQMVPMGVHAQYIKDLSFENPAAPQSLMPGQPMPAMTVNVTLDAKKIDDIPNNPNTAYEVILHIEATASRSDKPVFIIELDYGVICSINKDVPDKHHHPLLMIEAPKMAFPFARQILADVTAQAGFPPLLLNPVDFEGMYRAQYLREAQSANKQAV